MFNKQMFTQFLLDKSQSGQQYWCNVISIEIGIFHTIYIFKKNALGRTENWSKCIPRFCVII